MSQNHKDKERRKRNYNSLREVGYTSRESNRIKDFSDDRIAGIIELKKLQNAELNHALKTGGSKNGGN